MNDEYVTYQPNEEPDTVPQNPGAAAAKAPEKWEMPKPVFRKTSGVLPQGFAEKYAHLEALEAPTEEPNADEEAAVAEAAAGEELAPLTATASAYAPAPAAVQAQPDISELVSEEPPAPVAAAVEKKQRSLAMRLIMLAVGLGLAALFVAIFLAVIWYLFLRTPGESSVF